jgi:hypothetical protein
MERPSPGGPAVNLEVNKVVDDMFAFFEEYPEQEKKLINSKKSDKAFREVSEAFEQWIFERRNAN